MSMLELVLFVKLGHLVIAEIKQLLQEADIPPYPVAKINLDVSGPYSTSMSGNR